MLKELQEQWEDLDSRSFTQALRKRNPDIYDWVISQPISIETKTFTDKVFVLLNPNQPKCQNTECNNIVTKITRHGWASHCSKKCKGQHNSVKSRKKAVITSQKNWGVDNPAQHPTIRKQMIETTKERHGVEYALQSDTFQLKKTATMLDLYGVEHAAQSDTIQEKMVEKYLQNWGVKNPSVRHITQDTIDKLNNPEWLREQNKTLSFVPIAESLGISTATLGQAFRRFGIMPIRHNTLVSEPEKDLVKHILSILPNTKIITSDRSVLNPYELDIYLPDLNLAFEYNGLRYHSENFGKDHSYHLYKTEECAKKGIKLIHIWESDYIKNRDIILSKISHLLGNSKPIYARKCSIKELSIKEARDFFDKTHIQGYCSSTIKIGLSFEGKIVAAMTLGKSRFTPNAEWELLRYSSELNSNVVGGFSRLLKYFIKTYKPESIISYSDKCWSTGEVYKKNGFNFLRTSKPSYFYSKDDQTAENRMSFQKKKLKNKLKIFDETLTENENMKNNGYYRVWNCGNDAWLWENKTV